MKLDGALLASELAEAGRAARAYEDQGFDGVLSFEGTHDPFVPLVLAAAATERIELMYEQDLPGIAQGLVAIEPRTDEGAGDLERVLAHLSQNAPSFSLRGGTREILRGIIARGLGLR